MQIGTTQDELVLGRDWNTRVMAYSGDAVLDLRRVTRDEKELRKSADPIIQ